MIKVENMEVTGWEAAIRGMRNPMNSWEKSDSMFNIYKVSSFERKGAYKATNIYGDNKILYCDGSNPGDIRIGPNDLDLMKRLYQAGTEHRKFMRMIIVTMDITAPLYWWKEFDTYKVGTVANSCSTMHKIAEKDFVMDDFSHEHLFTVPENELVTIDINGKIHNYSANGMVYMMCKTLNHYRDLYLEEKDPDKKKRYWWQMIQLLPSSYNQRRTVQMSYENIVTIMKQRKGHKLDEWQQLIAEVEELPYIKEIME